MISWPWKCGQGVNASSTAAHIKDAAAHPGAPVRRDRRPRELLHVLLDPVFNQICDLLVVELYRQRVTVAENSHVGQVHGR